MKKHFRILRHGLTMVGRTLRSYVLLSVTIVLSFSLLLGYLGFVDSEIYNEYKYIFKINRGNVKIDDGIRNSNRFDTLLEKTSEMDDTCSYTVYYSWSQMSDGQYTTSAGNTLSARQIGVYFLSGYVWEFFLHFSEPYTIQWIDGQTHEYVDLKQGEAVLDLATYHALGLNEMDDPIYTFRFTNNQDDCLEMQVKIVGLVDLGGSFFTENGASLEYNSNYNPMILLPMSGMTYDDISILSPSRYAVFYSERPETIYNLATDLGYELGLEDSVYRWQDSVLETIQTRKSTKALITCAMLLILGINLYSSFSNALSERKFEIGVKRAIGASSFDIVRQFLYESITVMVVNILISIALVVDIGLIYRLIIQNTSGKNNFLHETYTLYLSPHSIGMFFTCSVTLTVVFSLIFAYKSTQVQVIDYLKAE